MILTIWAMLGQFLHSLSRNEYVRGLGQIVLGSVLILSFFVAVCFAYAIGWYGGSWTVGVLALLLLGILMYSTLELPPLITFTNRLRN